MWSKRVELDRLDGTGVLVNLLDDSITVSNQYSCHMRELVCVLTWRLPATCPHPTAPMPRCRARPLLFRKGKTRSADSRQCR